MSYEPKPVPTEHIQLSDEIKALTERLAESTHDVWARKRFQEGWKFGPKRDDIRKEHPCLIPYDQLADSEKEYDRATALETIKAILALGYRITRS